MLFIGGLQPLHITWLYMLTLGCVQLADIRSFNGGTISYTITQNSTSNKYEVHLDIITGWKVGTGPCGLTCNKVDIGKSTLQKRKSAGESYYGDWDLEIKRIGVRRTNVTRINSFMLLAMTEVVFAVSETANWEQEWMKVNIELEDNIEYEDITYEGAAWHDLSIQSPGSPPHWHIQAKIFPDIRNDTGRSNDSPRALVKPHYRVKLNSVSTINIATSDPDGDFIKCEKAKNIEAGSTAISDLSGMTVTEDCSVVINANSSRGYKNGDWVAIALMVRDYNRNLITFGKARYPPIALSLSGISVQFIVQVLGNLNEPEFVEPTLDNNHNEFILYVGARWKTDVYAKAVGNTIIDEFVVTHTGTEDIKTSAIHDDAARPLVRYTHMSWTPMTSDIGHHIVCVRVVDNTGVDASTDRCFSIEVKAEIFNHLSPVSTNKPYFVRIPTNNQTVSCNINATCMIPVYVRSTAALQSITITRNFFDKSSVGDILPVAHDATADYRIDLSVMHSTDGVYELCLIATDVNSTSSEETCINSDIKPLDPCLSSPCRNSGVCTRDARDPAVYLCECLPNMFEGRNCEKKIDHCASNPCVHGSCFSLPVGFYCSCSGDYTGHTCEQEINNCDQDTCNGHGICKDGVNSHTCACYKRYSGTDCSTDLCPLEPHGTIICPIATTGCSTDPCHGHGVCSEGGVCICRMGYITGDPTCSKAISKFWFREHTITFRPPTPSKGTTLTCYYTSTTPATCVIAVYYTSSDSTRPTIHITESSADLTSGSTVGQVSKVDFIPGVDNMYTNTITIHGNSETKGRKYMCISAKDGVSENQLCTELMFVLSPTENSKSMEMLQKDATYKFVQPTPLGNSKLFCHERQFCTILLFTTNNAGCQQVITADDDVTVFPPVTYRTSSCVSEVIFKFSSVGEKYICFHSAITDFQTRCVYVEVTPNRYHPCRSSPCQNNGICFSGNVTEDKHNCVCQNGYKGSDCEKGQCSTADNTCVRGYCTINNHVSTCICPLGYSGPKCEHEIPAPIPGTGTPGATFTDTAIPSVVTCVKNRPCTLPLVLSGKYPPTEKPSVVPGYISPDVSIDSITTVGRGQPTGSFQSSVQFTAKSSGMQDVCVQTTNTDGVNQDEMCFKLDVKTDSSSVYGFRDRPRFTDPSLPPDSHVLCSPGEPCHVIYHVTPGDGHDAECTDVTFSKIPFEDSNMFSSCENCQPGNAGNNNCSIDVTLVPTTAGIGQKSTVCLVASLTLNKEKGEERCFDISIKAKAELTVRKGCQVLHCQNGGFCNGHVDPAVCYCKQGFSGKSCNKVDTPSSSSPSVQTFIGGDIGIPKELKCIVFQPCVLPFQVTGKPNIAPNISFGYVDPSLPVDKPVIDVKVTGDKTTDYTGTVTVHPLRPGTHAVCIQTTEHSHIGDEMCITLNVGGGPLQPIDQTMPQFLNPTYNMDSTIICKAGEACHLDIHYTNGDKLGFTGKCPSLLETSPTAVTGLYIFASVLNAVDCNSDVLYTALVAGGGTTHKLCLQVVLPGKKGEERCINIKVGSDIKREVISPCSGKQCDNGGKCIADLAPSTPTVKCVCSHGYQGSECKTAVCVPPCAATGTCTVPDTCTCVAGYTGVTCSEVIVCTVTNVCKNGGTCFGTPRGVCSCTAGYTGSTCGTPIDCSITDICKNGGTCTGTSGVCSCAAGYTGSTCETKTSVTPLGETCPSEESGSTSTYCFTADATCRDTGSGLKCRCKNTHFETGSTCVQKATVTLGGSCPNVESTTTSIYCATSNAVCRDAGSGLKCQLYICEYIPESTITLGSICPTAESATASTSIYCATPDAVCRNSGSEATCQCKDTTFDSGFMCIQKTSVTPLGETCPSEESGSTSTYCVTTGATCRDTGSGLKCQCTDTHFESGSTCVQKATITLGGSCSNVESATTSLYCATTDALCRNTGSEPTCQCKETYVENGTTCVQNCDLKAAGVNARKSVSAGFASCYCMVKGKKVQIIRKRPVPTKARLARVAGFGAAGMTGAMALVIGIYVFATRGQKAAIEPVAKPGERRKPTHRPPRPSVKAITAKNLAF